MNRSGAYLLIEHLGVPLFVIEIGFLLHRNGTGPLACMGRSTDRARAVREIGCGALPSSRAPLHAGSPRDSGRCT
jgi:hypothetical protein